MDQHRVLILGSSLSAEAMTQILRLNRQTCVTERVSTLEAALVMLARRQFDVFVVVGTTDETSVWCLSALIRFPDLPILRSDLSTPKIQVITSRCIEARIEHLLAAIAGLPRRDSAALCLDPAARS